MVLGDCISTNPRICNRQAFIAADQSAYFKPLFWSCQARGCAITPLNLFLCTRARRMGLFALDLDYVPDFDKAAQPLPAFLGHHPKRPSHSEKKKGS